MWDASIYRILLFEVPNYPFSMRLDMPQRMHDFYDTLKYYLKPCIFLIITIRHIEYMDSGTMKIHSDDRNKFYEWILVYFDIFNDFIFQLNGKI